MEKLQLQAYTRDVAVAPNSLRNDGFIPAELYGHMVPNQHLYVKHNEFEKLFRKSGESTIVELLIEGNGTHNVLIQDVQRHFLNSGILHVDFHAVSMTEKLTATVQLEFSGESDAVKALGGTLVKVLDAVEVESLPANLPHSLVLDISVLKTFSDVVFAKNIPLPQGVTLVTDGEELVLKVQPPRDVEAELAQPVVEDVSTVGMVEKEKKEDEEVVEETKA